MSDTGSNNTTYKYNVAGVIIVVENNTSGTASVTFTSENQKHRNFLKNELEKLLSRDNYWTNCGITPQDTCTIVNFITPDKFNQANKNPVTAKVVDRFVQELSELYPTEGKLVSAIKRNRILNTRLNESNTMQEASAVASKLIPSAEELSKQLRKALEESGSITVTNPDVFANTCENIAQGILSLVVENAAGAGISSTPQPPSWIQNTGGGSGQGPGQGR